MLLVNGHNPWSVGSAQPFLSWVLDNKWHLPVGIRCRFEHVEEPVVALLDTGSSRSMIGDELAGDILDQVDIGFCEPTTMSTRLGSFDGWEYRSCVVFLAEAGNDLEIESTVVISEDWSGPPVIGFGGCLERIRFALDPGTRPDDALFYFGPVAD